MFDRILESRIHPIGISLFRICFCIVLLFEVIFMFNHKELFFDPIPFLKTSPIDTTVPLFIWMIVLLFLIVGFKTRIAAILNYIFILVFISSLNTFEYHIHYTYTGISFLFLFLPVSNTLSLDRLLKGGNVVLISKLDYFLPLVAGVGLVYFDSIFFKMSSDIWSKGMGMWLPASLPYVSKLQPNSFLNQEWLMTFLGYATYLFEVSFLFLVWFKKPRVLLLIVGLILHIGILVCFPIPLFAIGVIVLYILLVPVSWWIKLFSVNNVKTAIDVIPRINPLKRKIYLYVCIVFALLQLNITFNFSLALKPLASSVYSLLPQSESLKKGSYHLRVFSTKFFGITTHGVFMDSHFKGYNHVIAMKYQFKGKEIWLPIIDKDGRPGSLLKGATWVNWTWRVSSPKIDQNQLKDGLIRYASFYAGKYDLELENAQFIILVKEIDVPDELKWERDFLKNQISKPWEEIGNLLYDQNKVNFILNISEIIDE